jgi:hypothetical protein
MSNPHDDNHHAASVHTINNRITSHAKAKVIGLGLEFLDAGRERLTTERGDLFGDTALWLCVK